MLDPFDPDSPPKSVHDEIAENTQTAVTELESIFTAIETLDSNQQRRHEDITQTLHAIQRIEKSVNWMLWIVGVTAAALIVGSRW